MKSKYIIIFLFSLFAFCSPLCMAQQNVKEEIKKIQEVLKKTKAVSMDISYAAFSNYFSTRPLEVTKGSYKKNGNNYWSKLEEIEMCQNEKLVIYIDHEEKQMIVSSSLGKQESQNEVMQIDSLLKYDFRSSLKSFGSVNKITFEYKVQDEFNEYSKVEIYYDTKTYFVNKWVLFYAQNINLNEDGKNPVEKPRLEISYNNISFSEIVDKTVFSENKYFVHSGNKISGNGIYKSFEVIDQRFKK